MRQASRRASRDFVWGGATAGDGLHGHGGAYRFPRTIWYTLPPSASLTADRIQRVELGFQNGFRVGRSTGGFLSEPEGGAGKLYEPPTSAVATQGRPPHCWRRGFDR
jgi:hypothetical protein